MVASGTGSEEPEYECISWFIIIVRLAPLFHLASLPLPLPLPLLFLSLPLPPLLPHSSPTG